MPQGKNDNIGKHFSQLGQRTESPPILWLMRQALRQPNLISFAAGFTDNSTLPVGEIRQLIENILHDPNQARAALQYGANEGDQRLRQLTADRIDALDGRASQPSEANSVIITHGSQQLLYMLAEALCDPGDVILVEDPTYFVFLGIMQSRGIEARAIRIESDGLSIESLERVLQTLCRNGQIQRLKLLYSITYFQNPTGITTSLKKKQAAAELLRRYEPKAGHPIYYVEDAAYRELRFPNFQPPPSLLVDADLRERVIYTGTYSKPFAAGIRIGFGLLPLELRKVVLNIKGNHDFGTAHLLQKILAEALAPKNHAEDEKQNSGAYADHLAKITEQYAQKGQAMFDAVQEHFPAQTTTAAPQGGLCLWTALPQKVKTGPQTAFFQEVLENGILYVPGEYAYADDPSRPKPSSEMRLSFGSAPLEQIKTGIERLGKIIRRQCS